MRIIDDTGFPMMSEEEVEYIDNLLATYRPKKVLEWGSGNSTVWFSNKHPEIEQWIAIEHKKDYDELLTDKLDKNRAKIEMKSPNLETYVNGIALDQRFDLILVDGLFRDECLERAFEIINENGIILLHDSARKESAGMIKKYKGRYKIITEGELPQPDGFMAHRGLAVFPCGTSIARLMDIEITF